MIRHIVSWNFRVELSEAERKKQAQSLVQRFVELTKIVPGIVEFKVVAEALPASNRQFAINCLFQDQAALNAYQSHPAHKAIGADMSPLLQDRTCLDYEE